MTNQATYEAALRGGDFDQIFYELVHHPTQPLTVAEFTKLVMQHPERWRRYAEQIVNDQAADRKLSALSGLG